MSELQGDSLKGFLNKIQLSLHEASSAIENAYFPSLIHTFFNQLTHEHSS